MGIHNTFLKGAAPFSYADFSNMLHPTLHVLNSVTNNVPSYSCYKVQIQKVVSQAVSHVTRSYSLFKSGNPVRCTNKLQYLLLPFQGAIATTLTQPLDVLKTRAMNAKPGEFRGPLDLVKFTAKQGPMAFYKGYIPAFVRLGPHTVITFVFFEQLRQNFGFFPEEKK